MAAMVTGSQRRLKMPRLDAYVLRTHSTDEGGEPQGSRKGRPRYPLEGRGEQVDASTKRHMAETQNSGSHVKWS